MLACLSAGEGYGRFESRRWNVPKLTSSVMLERVVSVLENRRAMTEDTMLNVVCREVLTMDWCVHSGKILGARMLLNICQEDNMLMRSRTTRSESIDEAKPILEELGTDPNVNPLVMVIDKVPFVDHERISKLEATAMAALPSLLVVMQDRFHVAHHLSKHFNNMDTRFFTFAILGWRDATVVRDADDADHVVRMLKNGTIIKKRKHVKVTLGETFADDEISQMFATGVFHNLFSTDDVVVREYVKELDNLLPSIDAWEQSILDACFHPANANGHRAPILINGSKLIASVELLSKVVRNAKKRIVKCIPPKKGDGCIALAAWKETGTVDANGLKIYKPRFHTCGVESWNELQTNFVVGSTSSKELATGCFLEGNAKCIIRKGVECGLR